VAFSARQSIELFHLSLLRALAANAAVKSLIVLKGGANLRFFHGSPRYSEDIDFDVAVIAPGTLKNKLDRLLDAPALTAPLRAQGVEIVEKSAPKQTDTTQRWKVGLRVRDIAVPVRTKVEFSRRDALAEIEFGRLDVELLRAYRLTPFLATHYTPRAALAQKIHALSGRAEPQARDVFDLSLLLSLIGGKALTLSEPERTRVASAIEHAMSIGFDAYRSKVVAYLDPNQAELYGDASVWDTMQSSVVEQLEALR
jgi:predicted nucleotidyltransferase component of viral defense system